MRPAKSHLRVRDLATVVGQKHCDLEPEGALEPGDRGERVLVSGGWRQDRITLAHGLFPAGRNNYTFTKLMCKPIAGDSRAGRSSQCPEARPCKQPTGS